MSRKQKDVLYIILAIVAFVFGTIYFESTKAYLYTGQTESLQQHLTDVRVDGFIFLGVSIVGLLMKKWWGVGLLLISVVILIWSRLI